MEVDQQIEFRQERDLGTIISDTFRFFRLEWKPFFNFIFKIAIVPILVAVSAMLYFTFTSSKLFANSDFENPEAFEPTGFLGNSTDILSATLVMSICYLIAYVFINIGSLYYIKSYIENEGVVNFEEIKEKVQTQFWSFVGLGILICILVFVSAFLCFFPAIYTSVVMTFASCLFVFEQKTVMDAIGDSFMFIKGHWWTSFGCILVVSILVAILGAVFSAPALIYELTLGMSSLFEADLPSDRVGLLTDPIHMFLSAISTIGQFLLSSITLVATVFLYFDIRQQKTSSISGE